MTTRKRNSTTCAICGAQNEVLSIASTSAFGSPDLDLRPPETQRSTMPDWIDECTHCGYVAADLGEASTTARRLVLSADYSDCGDFDTAPPLSRRFIQAAKLADTSHDKALNSLFAAWACDDAQQPDHAAAARRLAATHLRQALPELDLESRWAEQLRLIDILRRCEAYDAAIAEVHSLLAAGDLDSTLIRIARFQKARCDSQDDGRYTLAEALADE